MSLGIYPVFNPELMGTKFDALGERLAVNFEALDQTACSAGLTPFTAFADNRTVPEDFEGDPEDLADVMGEWTEWFDPAEGQAVMQAIAGHIKANPTAAEQLDDPDEVVAELEELARVLAAAAVEGARFRLQMS
ncbi:hypothetical protein [Fimbriiglobus ruber]|uniref:Uncharacterized protein n=1 Tax=Fimbriiglobus ruber TaxID=1908690 RepID=A0A225DLJ1_9BACT|nr:hypothetical protein [Fimbriiglobus ruber]OWK38069.1 hypothetical protein FRUB_07189 [Fimbriiglobus ruber]